MGLLSDNDILRLSDGIVVDDLRDGTGVLYDVVSDRAGSLNETAFVILSLVDGKNSVVEIGNAFLSKLDFDSIAAQHATENDVLHHCYVALEKLVENGFCIKKEV